MIQKESIRFMKKGWIIFMLSLSLLSSIGIIVWSRYEDSKTNMKRVIVAVTESATRFSSNYMEKTLISRPRPISAGATKIALNGVQYYPVDVVVRNYSAEDPYKYFETAFTCTLDAYISDISGNPLNKADKASLVKYDANGDQSDVKDFVLVGNGDNARYRIAGTNSVPITGMLAPDGTHVLTYHFLFAASLLDAEENVYVRLKATPDDSTELRALEGVIGITTQTAEIALTWEGYFNDEGANEEENSRTQAGTFDGFNYVITGSGSRTVKLSWCTDRLELNLFNDLPSSYTEDTFTEGEGNSLLNWKSRTFSVNSNTTSRYDIQFYMVNSNETYYDDWDTEVKQYVRFDPDVTASGS